MEDDLTMAADRGEHRQAAGAVAKGVRIDLSSLASIREKLQNRAGRGCLARTIMGHDQDGPSTVYCIAEP